MHGPKRLAFLLIATLLAFGSWFGALGAVAQDTTGVGSAVQPGGDLPGDPSVQLVKVAGGLVDPINVAAPQDDSGRLFVVERTGTIRIIQDGQVLEEPFLDISGEVKTDFLEQGLLGLAFHPDYANNGRFFVFYSDYRTNGDHFLVEYTVSADDPNVADEESGRVLLSVEDPFINHNGGTIQFGPDGYLYVTIGDGGLAGDPYDTAQDLSTLLGKILRLDVDVDPAIAPYGIPDDNPFADGGVWQSGTANPVAQTGDYRPDARPEIYMYGLRNAWQFSFDPETGDMYIADVGQVAWEEINFKPADQPGGQNYGWDIMEASHCYPPTEEECVPFGVLPVAEYAHDDQGGCSITGVGVYRGSQSTDLDGIYFSSDFCTGRLWGLERDDAGTWHFEELLDTELAVTGSGRGADGELYLTSCSCMFGRDYDPFADPQGAVWQVVSADQVPEGAETAPLAEGTEEGATREDEGEATEASPEATPAG